jgi:glucokinase
MHAAAAEEKETGKFMVHAVRSNVQSMPSPKRIFLAADVGGTHARIGLVDLHPGGRRPVTLVQYRRYICAEWPSLSAMLKDFVDQLGFDVKVEHCAVACAGYVFGDAVVNDNLPWDVSIRDIRETLHVSGLAVINDFEAVAYATQFLEPEDWTSIIEARAPLTEGPVLVMGPGTGMGSAVLLPGQPHATVLTTEAGQAALAPGTGREIEILRVLSRNRSYVSYENVLSGPGLMNLYRAISVLRDTPVVLHAPTDITRAALAHTDMAAVETVDVFCGLLGSFVGDLVLNYGARGGVYLAGGILPQIRELLLRSTFTERFFNKGVMTAYVQQVPVRLMEHGQHGVIGAAGLYLVSNNNVSST